MTDIFLYQGEPTPTDIKLCDPTVLCDGAPATGQPLVKRMGGTPYMGGLRASGYAVWSPER